MKTIANRWFSENFVYGTLKLCNLIASFSYPFCQFYGLFLSSPKGTDNWLIIQARVHDNYCLLSLIYLHVVWTTERAKDVMSYEKWGILLGILWHINLQPVIKILGTKRSNFCLTVPKIFFWNFWHILVAPSIKK